MAGQRKRNPNGAGTITKRKDGRFQCAVYVLQPDGTRARKFAYGKTWAECDTKRRELLAKVDQGVPVPTRSAKLSEWLPYWLDNVIKPRRKLSTYDKYEAHVRLYLVPLLGSKRLESFGVADVRRFLIRLEKETTAATAKESHRVLRSALSSACREELIARNVAKLVEPRRRGVLYDDDPKSRRRRVVPLPALCIAPLRWHRMRQSAARAKAGEQWQESGYVFTTRTGRQVEPRNVYRSFTRVAEFAGLRVIRLHDARHGTATLLTAAGVAPRVVMEILGHSQISITMDVYTHVVQDTQRDAINHMDRLLKRRPGSR
ncbi:tyrosine-type recombinase/integrase [Streptomyces mirabilis]|uniref:tyrosine-type recombinase/integrase n=1 Tax=Streptomyces mirabilis TaxID=68239 RepID=UPI003696B09F